MANRIDGGQKLRARLLKDLAHRIRYRWVMYVVFCAFFAIQTDFGGAHPLASWTFLFLMVGGGVFRMWRGRTVEACGEDEVAGVSRMFVASIGLHSILWGAFVSYALWAEPGNQVIVISLIIGVAGFGTGGGVVLAPCPVLAWIHLGIQCGAVLAWSLLANHPAGLMILTLVVGFVAFVGATIRGFHSHVLGMFRAQILLEERIEELTRAKEAAEEASSARGRFLANMSHEIRTPLHGVLGLTQILGETPLNDAQKELLSTLNRSGTHLLAIVDDILDWSKISSGRLVVESVLFDLEALLADVSAPAEALAHAKGLRWRLDCPGDLTASYRGDPVRIRQVLTNLLSNAVKFTESGEVMLRVERSRPGWVTFVVADTGIGISESQARTLFRDFTQADASTTRRFGGTGLGLAISKRLLEVMGGTLTLESRPGAGSAFTAALPLPEGPVCSFRPVAVKDGPALTAAAGRRILVAEDHPVNRMIAERFLAGTGATVETAENGRVAVERHSAHPYDLILMDCHMPEMDGYEATAAIRALDAAADVPILAVTASALLEDRERCRRAGMNAYVAKPLRREELLRAVAAALEDRGWGLGL